MANFTIPYSAANGGIDCGILASKRAIYPYADGKRASDIPSATNFGIALHGNGLTILNVKVEGADPLPEISDEDIRIASAALKPILVCPKECLVTLYPIDGQMRMSATASGIEVVSSGTNK